MHNNDLTKFAQIMMVLNETFVGNKEISKHLIEVYFRALKEYDIGDIDLATNNIIRTWKFNCLPKPAEFIEFISGDETDNALSAWQHVLDQLGTKGIDRAVFDDATQQAINGCGGAQAIGHAPTDKLVFLQKNFIANYKVTNRRISIGQSENKRLKGLTKNMLKDIND